MGRETHKTLIVSPAALTAKAGVNSYKSISLPTNTSRGTTTANAGVPKTDQVLKWYTPFYNTHVEVSFWTTAEYVSYAFPIRSLPPAVSILSCCRL